jgi:hypothetical protein
MWHATYMQGNRVDSWLLVVGSQTTNLTFGPSFDHNLCFRCPNGSCEPISNIYIPKSFQWGKERFNLMSFDPCDRSLKIRESTGTLTPNMGVHLGVWEFFPSHSLHSRASLLARTLASPCLGREPKARVATFMINEEHLISWLCTVLQQRFFIVLVIPLQVLKNYWKQTFFFQNPQAF